MSNQFSIPVSAQAQLGVQGSGQASAAAAGLTAAGINITGTAVSPGTSQVAISGTGLTNISVPAGTFTCLTGVIQTQPQIGIPFAGQFFLVDPLSGRRLAALQADPAVNLASLVGQMATVCGTSQGPIEGLTTIRVTSASAATPTFGQNPNATLAQLLLQLIFANPSLLLQLLSALQSPFGGFGLAGSGIGALGGLQGALSTGLAQAGMPGQAGVAALSGLSAAAAPFGTMGMPAGAAGMPFGFPGANPLAGLGQANPLAALGNANPLAGLGATNAFTGGNVGGIPMPQGVSGVGNF